MKLDKDELYLIKDFLEEMHGNHLDKDFWEYSKAAMEEHAEQEYMFERTIELISKLIEENK